MGYCKAVRVGRRGRLSSFYFLAPPGEEAFRQRTGSYADRTQGPSLKHKGIVDEVVRILGVTRKPHARFDILYDENGRDRAIEVETGSNNNGQILEKLRKSLEFQQEGRFVVVDAKVANRVLQVAASEAFTTRSPILVLIAEVESLPAWTKYEFQPVPSTT